MLDFGLPLRTTAASPSVVPPRFTAAPQGPVMADVHAGTLARSDLTASTRDRYASAIDRLAELLNQPLASIPADPDLIGTRFPLDGFDPHRWPTDAAYQTWRRRVQAALRHFLGVHEERARLRAMEDGWTAFHEAVLPLTRGKSGTWLWHPMKLRNLRTFALEARAIGVQPWEFALVHALRIDAASQGNKRAANRRAIRQLDELRAFPELGPLLPPQPVAFAPPSTVRPCSLPGAWEEQIGAWVRRVTETGWDPAARSHTDRHEEHARVMTSALRTSLRAALRIGLIDAGSADTPLALLRDDEAVRLLAAEIFASCSRARTAGGIAPRTARKYLRAVGQVRSMLGIAGTELDQILANNETARRGRLDDKSMTPGNRKFCEGLVGKAPLRQRFFRSHRTLRDEAERLLADAGDTAGALTGHRLARVRMLGAAAAFCALEIGGAPIRVGNAMALTCTGEDAWVTFPARV